MLAATAHAQQQTVTLSNTKFVSLSSIDTQSPRLAGIFSDVDLSTFFKQLFIFAISIGGVIAVFKLGQAGWLYMTGDTLGTVGGIRRAKDIVRSVIIGLLFLLSGWLLLNQINSGILNLDVLHQLK